MSTMGINSRRDLSFTKTSDQPGVVSNWYVPHDMEGYWGDTVPVGRRYFAEVAELASINEDEAYYAILTAINAAEWNHANGGVGWGIEHGFSERLAAAALIGLRALRDGAAPYIQQRDKNE